MKLRVEAVIPVYRPDQKLLDLVDMLEKQTCVPEKIHIVNTDRAVLQKCLEKLGLTEERFLSMHPLLDLVHIRKEEFDHGAARNLGAGRCAGDFLLFMTQDAVPADEKLVEAITAPLMKDPSLAASFARQIPYADASAAERFSRSFNYPETPRITSEADFPRLGIKTYFCSNVCAAYRRDIFQKLGGFPTPMIFNEDMVYAGRALKAGYRIRYSPEARVFHSHHYTARQQYRRNFDLGVSQAMHPEIFAGSASEGEGVRYVKAALRYLMKEKKTEIPGFLWTCAARFFGYRRGKNYRKLSRKKILASTMNPGFWDILQEKEK